MRSVFFKMTGIYAKYFNNEFILALAPKSLLEKEFNMSLRKERDKSVAWSLVMPNSDHQDRIVYPNHKLMIDSFNLDSKL